ISACEKKGEARRQQMIALVHIQRIDELVVLHVTIERRAAANSYTARDADVPVRGDRRRVYHDARYATKRSPVRRGWCCQRRADEGVSIERERCCICHRRCEHILV